MFVDVEIPIHTPPKIAIDTGAIVCAGINLA
jgi:hypothetical protein